MSMIHSLKRSLARLVRKMPAPFHRLPEEWKHSYIRSAIKRRYTETDGSHVKPMPKVFGIGLSKTATTSLNEALCLLGYNSAHWTHEGERVLGWPEFFYVDAATDTPCASQFESLYHTFEDAQFIYTVRDIDSWKCSMKAHFGMHSPREFRKLWKEQEFWNGSFGWRWYNSLRWVQIHESLYAQHDTWEEAYRVFDRRVQRFFEDKPSDRFLTMNITEGDGWGALCSFLDMPHPDRAFPHAGRTADEEHVNKVERYKELGRR